MAYPPTASGLIRAAADGVEKRAELICEADERVWVPVRVQYGMAAAEEVLRVLAQKKDGWSPSELLALARELRQDNPPAQVKPARPLTLVP